MVATVTMWNVGNENTESETDWLDVILVGTWMKGCDMDVRWTAAGFLW